MLCSRGICCMCLIWSVLFLCSTHVTPVDSSISSDPSYANVEEAGPSFCQEYLTLPGSEEDVLDTEEKISIFANSLPSYLKPLAENRDVFQIEKFIPADVQLFVFFWQFNPPGGKENLAKWLAANMTSSSDLVNLKSVIVSQPLFLMMLQRPLADNVLGLMTEQELETFCVMMFLPPASSAYAAVILKHFPHCAVLMKKLKADGKDTFFTLGPVQGAMIYQRLRDGGLQLNIKDFEIYPYYITFKDVDNLPDEDFEVMSNQKTLGLVLTYLSSETRQHIARRLVGVLGNPGTWTNETMTNVGNYVMFLPMEEMEQYVTEEMINYFLDKGTYIHENFAWFFIKDLHMKRDTPNFKKRFCYVVLFYPHVFTTLLNDFSSSEIFNGVDGCESETAYMIGTPGDFTDFIYYAAASKLFSATDLAANLVEYRRYLQDKLLVQVNGMLHDLNLPANTTADELLKASMIFDYIPMNVFEKMDADELYRAWSDPVNSVTLNLPKLTAIYQKIKDKFPAFEDFEASDFMKLGSLMSVLSCDDIENIPEASLREAVIVNGFFSKKNIDCDQNEEICWLLVSRMLRNATDEEKYVLVSEMSYMARYVKLEDLGEQSSSSIFFTERVGNAVLERGQTAPVRDIRSIDERSDITPQGNNKDIYADLPVQGYSLELLSSAQFQMKALSSQFVYPKRNQLQLGYNFLKKAYALDDNTKEDICLTQFVADTTGCFFTRASKFHLSRLSRESILLVLWAEGRLGFCVETMLPEQLREHFETLYEADTELNQANQWTPEMILERGPFLFCGMTVEHVSKLSPEAAVMLADSVCRCQQMDTMARQAFFGKVLEHYGSLDNLFRFPSHIKDLGSCLMLVSPDDIKVMNLEAKKLLVSMTYIIVSAIQDRFDSLERDDTRKIDVLIEKVAAGKAVESFIDVMDNLAVPFIVQMAKLGHFQHHISAETFRDLTVDEFKRLTEYFKGRQPATEAQIQAIRAKANEAYGAVSTWPRENFQTLREMLPSLLRTSSEISTAGMDNCTISSILSSYREDDEFFFNMCDQLDQGSHVELALQNPQLVCCMQFSTVMDLDNAVVVELVKAFDGVCPSCLRDQSIVRPLAFKYFTSFEGNEVKPSDYRDAKCLAAHSSVFSLDLSVPTISQFDLQAIRDLDEEEFCQAVSLELLKAFSREQILSLTENQLSCLDAIQYKAVYSGFDTLGNMTEDFDFSTTEVGNAPDFDKLENTLIKPITQNVMGQLITCAPVTGKNGLFISTQELALLRENDISEEQRVVLDKITARDDMPVSFLAYLDLIKILEELAQLSEEQLSKTLQLAADLPTLLESNDADEQKFLDETLASMNPLLYTLFNPQTLCSGLKRMKRYHLELFCNRLSEDDVTLETFTVVNEVCPVCLTYLEKKMMGGDNSPDILDTSLVVFGQLDGVPVGNKGGLDAKKGSSFYNMMMRSKSNLDLSVLTVLPAALTPDIVRAVGEENFHDMGQLSTLSNPSTYMETPKHVLKMLVHRIIEAQGPIELWPHLMKSKFRKFIFYLSREDMRTVLNAEVILEALTSEDMNGIIDDRDISTYVGQKINAYVMREYPFAPRELLQRPEIFCFQLAAGLPKQLLRKEVSPYPPDFLMDMASECSRFFVVPKDVSRKYTHYLLKQSGLDATSFLGRFISMMGHLSATELRTFPSSALGQLPEFNDFNNRQLFSIWNAIKDLYPVTDLDCPLIGWLGKLMKVWSSSYIDGIRTSDIKGCIRTIAGVFTKEEAQNFPTVFSRGFWKKLKASLDADSMSVAEYVNTQDFDPKMFNVIPKEEMKSDEFQNLSWQKIIEIATYGKGSGVAELVKRRVNLNNVIHQKVMMENPAIAKIILSFGSKEEIDKLKAGNAMGYMLEKMSAQASQLSSKALELNFDLLKKRIGLMEGCKAETICLDDSQAMVFAGLFLVARPSDLNCLTKATQRVVLETIGRHQEWCRRLTRSEIRNLLDMVLQVTSMDPNASIMDYGCLACGYTEKQITELTDGDVDNMHPLLSRCFHLDLNTSKAVVDKTIRNNGGLKEYIEKNPDLALGPLMKHVSPSDILALPEMEIELLGANLGYIASRLNEEAEDIHVRVDRGEISKQEEEIHEERKNQVLSAIYTVSAVFPDSGSTSGSTLFPRRRRKRSLETDFEICTLLQEFQGNICFLTIDLVDGFSDNLVRICVDEFQHCDYSVEILTALAMKAERALGKPADEWTAIDYQELGKLIAVMDEDTINKMALTDDIMALLPLDTAFTNNQLILRQYLAFHNKTLSDLEAEHIADWALLLASVDIEELNDLEPMKVGEAAVSYDLGSAHLNTFEKEKIQLLTNKIIESDKIDFKEVDAVEISNLGPLAGALPENVLNAMTGEQKQGLTGDAIKIIPAEILSTAFTADDLQRFSYEQISAVTPEQKAMLSSDMMDALNKATNVEPEKSSGTLTQNSVALLAFIMLWSIKKLVLS